MVLRFAMDYLQDRMASTSIGLDIQPHAIHLVRLKHYPRQVIVEQLLSKLFAGEVGFRDFSMVLSGLSKLSGLKGEKVAIALAIQDVSLRTMQLPLGLTEDEMRSLVERKLIGREDARDLYMDITRLGALSAGFQSVQVTLVKQQLIDAWQDRLKQVGFVLKVIDVDVYALVRAVCHSLRWQVLKSKLGAILYCANGRLLLIGFDAKSILFHHVYIVNEVDLVGLGDLIQGQVQKALSLHQLEACQQLVVCGVESERIILRDFPHLVCRDPFMHAKKQSHIGSNLEYDNFWLAFGLALREMPAW